MPFATSNMHHNILRDDEKVDVREKNPDQIEESVRDDLMSMDRENKDPMSPPSRNVRASVAKDRSKARVLNLDLDAISHENVESSPDGGPKANFSRGGPKQPSLVSESDKSRRTFSIAKAIKKLGNIRMRQEKEKEEKNAMRFERKLTLAKNREERERIKFVSEMDNLAKESTTNKS